MDNDHRTKEGVDYQHVIETCAPCIRDSSLRTSRRTLLEGAHAGKVHSVYDGDTLRASFSVGGEAHCFSVRLFGVDTPELRSRNADLRALAFRARDWVRGKVQGKVCCFVFHPSSDKYGRLLADVVDPTGDDLAEGLVREGLALPYQGGSKASDRDWAPLSAPQQPLPESQRREGESEA